MKAKQQMQISKKVEQDQDLTVNKREGEHQTMLQ